MCYVCNVQQFREAIGEKSQTTDRAPGPVSGEEEEKHFHAFIHFTDERLDEGRKEGGRRCGGRINEPTFPSAHTSTERGRIDMRWMEGWIMGRRRRGRRGRRAWTEMKWIRFCSHTRRRRGSKISKRWRSRRPRFPSPPSIAIIFKTVDDCARWLEALSGPRVMLCRGSINWTGNVNMSGGNLGINIRGKVGIPTPLAASPNLQRGYI